MLDFFLNFLVQNQLSSSMPAIKFDPSKGPITIEITSGYASLGAYELFYGKPEFANFKPFGASPKRIDDHIIDIHALPVALSELPGHRIIVVGKYGKAPGHDQISVVYEIVQNNKVLGSEKIEEAINSEFKRYRHTFDFKAK